MRDLSYASIFVAVAAATTTPCFGTIQREGAASSSRPSGIILAQAAAKATSPATTVARAATVVISGRVQGVGFRDWVVRRARALGVRGWVENADHGTVHALFGGTDAALTAMLAACHQGPRGASVRDVVELPAEVANFPTGFRRRN